MIRLLTIISLFLCVSASGTFAGERRVHSTAKIATEERLPGLFGILEAIVQPRERSTPGPHVKKERRKVVKRGQGPSRPVHASVPVATPDPVLMSVGPHRLTQSRLIYIAKAILVCALDEANQTKHVIDCKVKEGEGETEYSLTHACSELWLCMYAVITREWCHAHDGEWKIGEKEWVCSFKS